MLVFSLVFRAEEAALPHVGEAFLVADLLDVLLKGVFDAFGVGMSGVRLAEDVAQVVEVRLRPFGAR